MKNKLNSILLALQALAALVLVGAIKIWAPVCGKMLTLTTGKEVPMKCHWTAQAALAVAIILVAVAVVAFFAKQDQKKFFIVTAVIGVIIFMLFTSLMGVCASPDMRCNTTALWAKLVSAVVIGSSLVGLIGGKEGQIPN